MKTSVAVFGSSRTPPGDPNYDLARELGRALGRRGAEVRCGGYAGVMGALAEGVKDVRGRVVGCTLDWFADTRAPNPLLDDVVSAPDLSTRIERLLEGTRAAIALPGGIGTLNEVFWLWTLLMHGKGMNRRLILLGDSWRDLLELLSRRFEVDAPIRALVHAVTTVDQAVDLACGARA